MDSPLCNLLIASANTPEMSSESNFGHCDNFDSKGTVFVHTTFSNLELLMF